MGNCYAILQLRYLFWFIEVHQNDNRQGNEMQLLHRTRFKTLFLIKKATEINDIVFELPINFSVKAQPDACKF